MKNLALLMFALCLFTRAFSQDNNNSFQFGKPTQEEFSMNSYSKDTTAPAVILYEEMVVYYEINQQGNLFQNRTITRKIKVLEKEGASYGDVEISLYRPDNSTCILEKVEACSFNMENGKTVKSPVKKQMIFREKVSDNMTLVKFSIPNIKAGSIIEYRYTVRDDLIFNIPSHEFQHDIPTIYSRVSYSIPEYFKFNIMVSGYQHVDVQKGSQSKTAFIAGYPLTFEENIVTGIAADVPALKNEPYVWNYKEYISKLSLELDEYRFPGQLVQKISSDWKTVCENLKESRFGTHMKMDNPLRKEMAGLYAADASDEEKIRKILQLLKSRIKWNKKIALLTNSPKSALDKGEGNSADINFILRAMLEDAGFVATPMLLNPRYLNRIRFRATLEGINCFILQVKMSDGKICYLDGTNEFADINLLPEYLLVDKAHLYGDFTNTFHDLTALTHNSTRRSIAGKIDTSGAFRINMRIQYNNMDAFNANNRLARYNSKEEYIESLEKQMQKTVSDYKIDKSNTKVVESYGFDLESATAGDFIYLKAILLPEFSSNPFKAPDRKLPIEFDHPRTSRTDCTYTIPDGYTVEEMPGNTAITACEGGLQARFITAQNNNTVQVSFTFNIGRIIFVPSEYEEISAFFAKLMELSGQQIVLKKQVQQ